MELKIKSGGKDILHSGSVMSYEENTIVIELSSEMTMEFIFEEDPNRGESIESRFIPITPTYMKVFFVNFNSGLGAGSTTPVPLGDIDGRNLYMNYRISRLGNTRNLEYTFYLDSVKK